MSPPTETSKPRASAWLRAPRLTRPAYRRSSGAGSAASDAVIVSSRSRYSRSSPKRPGKRPIHGCPRSTLNAYDPDRQRSSPSPMASLSRMVPKPRVTLSSAKAGAVMAERVRRVVANMRIIFPSSKRPPACSLWVPVPHGTAAFATLPRIISVCGLKVTLDGQSLGFLNADRRRPHEKGRAMARPSAARLFFRLRTR